MSQRWEYLRTQVNVNKINSIDDDIDRLGLEGWELVSAVYTETYVHFWFKRPKGG